MPEITDSARAELEQSVAAWERYLETKPKRPPTAAAAEAAQAYQLLLDPAGAAEAQAIVAEAQGTSAAFYQLALYLYADGKIKAGDAAGERAVEAADSSTAQRRAQERRAARRAGPRAEAQARPAAGGAVAGLGRRGDRGPLRRPLGRRPNHRPDALIQAGRRPVAGSYHHAPGR